jgi:hypothetical protein
MRRVTRHFADQEQRNVAKLHLLASLDGERGHFAGLDFGDEFSDAACDLHSVFVELRFPEQTGKHRATELKLRCQIARRRALMCKRTVTEIE